MTLHARDRFKIPSNTARVARAAFPKKNAASDKPWEKRLAQMAIICWKRSMTTVPHSGCERFPPWTSCAGSGSSNTMCKTVK